MAHQRDLAVAFGIVFGVCALPFVVLSLYELDDEVTRGERYGFAIGEDYSTILSSIDADHESQGWTDAMILGERSDLRIIDVSELRLNDIEHVEVITLRYGNSSPNSLRLHFENGELVRMYRHRLLFERP